ncbi:uncharacterized protein LOC110989103 isoform X1 [Acanthaster planci]|uniref:Uncharacterized protein LOC110989103 isoform X1 n=1 Tax=Acanthaster planci TaxID=133434 RepID=A0A8B7ZTM1_ACAPL|nr:uncharacterized protein LOC110989103 isoform X1 [Acanthaster planci]
MEPERTCKIRENVEEVGHQKKMANDERWLFTSQQQACTHVSSNHPDVKRMNWSRCVHVESAWIVTNDVLTSPEVDVLKSAEVDSLMLVEVGKNTRCVGRRSASFPSEEWTSASPL